MNRRGFLKIVFTAAAVTALPITLTKALEKTAPVIYGDGIHDDTAGLNAAINGRDFIARNECVKVHGNRIWLAQGCTYRLTDSLCFEKGTEGMHLDGRGATLDFNDAKNISACIHVESL